MADATLLEFVREALARGESRERIQSALEGAGWQADQVRDALNAFAEVDFAVPVPRPRRSGSAREAFLYIVYFILLGVVAGYIGALSFAWIDYAFTDDVFGRSWRSGARFLRWGVAWLLVGMPIFLLLGWRLGERRRRDPERRTSRVRVWLTYIALIFAATTLIGDIVYVVFRFLGGDLGSRFMAKALVVAVISGAIVINYTRDAERSGAVRDLLGWAIATGATIAAVVLVIWAFTVINSPFAARARAADEARLTHLSTIARLVDCHREYAGETPADLELMAEDRDRRIASGGLMARGCEVDTPLDPMTGASYAYRRIDADRYQLCAAFQRGWPDAEARDRRRRLQYPGRYGTDEAPTIMLPNAAGEACFDFAAIDFPDADEASPR